MRSASLGPVAMLALASAAGCQGSLPKTQGDPSFGYGAVLVRGRLLLPSGETYNGQLAMNLESDDHRYVVPFTPGRTALFIVEPGSYRLVPTRGPFGVVERTLPVIVERRVLRVPFPRAILRKAAIDIRPGHVVPIGILEATVGRPPGSRQVQTALRLDDSQHAQRQLVEQKIQHMLDSRVPLEERESATVWSKALDNALQNVYADERRRPGFKLGVFE